MIFIEKAFQLLAENGFNEFICPHKFINSDFGSGLRQFLINNKSLKTFISFGNNLIFNKVSTYTGIVTLQKKENVSFEYYEFPDTPILKLPTELMELKQENFSAYNIESLTSDPWMLTSNSRKSLLEKMSKHSNTIGSTFESVFQGVVTGVDDIYLLEKISSNEGEIFQLRSQRENEIIAIEKSILKPMLKGEDINRYSQPKFKYYCIYPYKQVGKKTAILEENELSELYPLAYQYLTKYKHELINLRIKFKTNPKYWYSCHRGRSIPLFNKERIITPEISLGCNMTISTKGVYHNTKIYSIIPPKRPEHINYWLGILNSKILWWFLSNTGYVLRGGYFVFKTNYLKPFPICIIDFSNPADVARHDRMVSLVQTMLDLHKQLAATKGEHERTMLQRQIEATDRQIDALVYELYGLTEEEIRIVEEACK